MTDKTPTERLRELLDERGVEHFDHENVEPLRVIEEAGPDPATSWRIGGASFCAIPDRHGTLDVWIDHAAPEQAVEATLGRGECSIEHTCHVPIAGFSDQYNDEFSCSECGEEMFEHFKYCPNCGAKVSDE